MKPASTTSAGSKRSISSMSAASNASRLAKARWSSAAVAMPWPRAQARPGASARLLITATTSAPWRSRQRRCCDAATMAAMFEPLPEIRMTMFLCTCCARAP